MKKDVLHCSFISDVINMHLFGLLNDLFRGYPLKKKTNFDCKPLNMEFLMRFFKTQ